VSYKLDIVSVLGASYWSASIYRDAKPFPFTTVLDNSTTGMYHKSRVGEMVEDHTNANSNVNTIVSVNHQCHCIEDKTISFH
jgi:hypothetical protein